MPHVIISGMPGIGKTTSILCLARQLLGPAYKEAVLELNASDERGQADFNLWVQQADVGRRQASMWSETELKDLHRRKSRCLQVGTRS